MLYDACETQDALHSDVVEALMTSTNVIVAELFDPVAGKRAVKVSEIDDRGAGRGYGNSSGFCSWTFIFF